MEELLIGIDIGTTHLKSALFDADLQLLQMVSGTMPRTPAGYDPAELRMRLHAQLQSLSRHIGGGELLGIGIASMAETGLLLSPEGEEATPLIPWFDRSSEKESEFLTEQFHHADFFASRGIRPSYKTAVAKLLHLSQTSPGLVRDGCRWLSAADYIIYCLTGAIATDFSLANRTYALSLPERSWDRDWLEEIGLPAGLFPELLQAGTPAGTLSRDAAAASGLPAGVPVIPCGHDHVCGSLGAGAARPGTIFSSMGTAEAITGIFSTDASNIASGLQEEQFRSNISYGLHVLPDTLYWMSGCSASGGSVEWVMDMLLSEHSYERFLELLATASPGPTSILYFPYLNGRSGTAGNTAVTGGFLGLTVSHTKADIAKAVLEGTTYEIELIRQRAEQAVGTVYEEVVTAGGGTRNRLWMQIKSSVMAADILVPACRETTLCGAAMLAALAAGIFPNPEEAMRPVRERAAERYSPDAAESELYRRLPLARYRELQQLFD